MQIVVGWLDSAIAVKKNNVQNAAGGFSVRQLWQSCQKAVQKLIKSNMHISEELWKFT